MDYEIQQFRFKLVAGRYVKIENTHTKHMQTQQKCHKILEKQREHLSTQSEKNVYKFIFFRLPLPSPLSLQVGRSPRCHRGTWETCPYNSSATEQEKSEKQGEES